MHNLFRLHAPKELILQMNLNSKNVAIQFIWLILSSVNCFIIYIRTCVRKDPTKIFMTSPFVVRTLLSGREGVCGVSTVLRILTSLLVLVLDRSYTSSCRRRHKFICIDLMVARIRCLPLTAWQQQGA